MLGLYHRDPSSWYQGPLPPSSPTPLKVLIIFSRPSLLRFGNCIKSRRLRQLKRSADGLLFWGFLIKVVV